MIYKIFPAALLILLLSQCAKLPIDPAFKQRTVSVQADSITFAIIGDYGSDSKEEGQVADMVKSWNPDFIITTGDNNYPLGLAGSINKNIGKYYSDYIYNPDAPLNERCNGKAARDTFNRFFPSPGNHDNYATPALQPYLDYFTLPGDERNYDFQWGPAHFYSMNTGIHGKLDVNSREAQWLQSTAAADTSPFKFVYFHHPPYSVSHHGSSVDMQWPYARWGIDAVLSGHEHAYERITAKDGTAPLYLVCGVSGNPEKYSCTENTVDANRFNVLCNSDHFGAMKVTVTKHQTVFKFFTIDDPVNPFDIYIINK